MFAGSGIRHAVREAVALWRPPRRLFLDEWCDEFFYLSAESAAEPGRWTTIPYQREPMRMLTDPRVERVTWIKSARVGATKILNGYIAYLIDQDPGPIMVMQPTLSLAQRYSKKEIAPMLRDCPVLRGKVSEPKSKDSNNTILEKGFTGGSLMIVGASSPTDLRSVSIRVMLGDEADGWPGSVGDEGDPGLLAEQRTGYYWNRKIVYISTPLNEGESRIETLFLQGDQRRYYVPCPSCHHMDVLVWRDPDDPDGDEPGHWLTWPENTPDAAHFMCSSCHEKIEHKHKRWMVERGEWRGARRFEETIGADGRGHASFHIWAGYSYSPNASWAKIVAAYLQAKEAGPLKLKTFYNTWLGRTWRVRGDAPKWEDLWKRREHYDPAVAHARVEYITAGVDVQGDRLVYEVVGWANNQESWSLETGEISGDTSTTTSDVWDKLDTLLAKSWRTADGRVLPICQMAVDSGWNTQIVYAWVRRHDRRRVMAIKGDGTPTADHPIMGTSDADVNIHGDTIVGGVTVWRLGVCKLKEELYGWLHLAPPSEGESYPSGWCHFPNHPESYFQQLTAEQRVRIRNKKGDMVTHWMVLAGRENHVLDARNYARGAAVRVGIDRLPSRPPAPQPAKPKPAADGQRRVGGWLGGRGGGRRDGRPWLG